MRVRKKISLTRTRCFSHSLSLTVFTAKVGKVAGEGKIVRSGSEVITGSFD